MKQFDHMIERKLNLELSNVFPRLKFLTGCGQFSDFSNNIYRITGHVVKEGMPEHRNDGTPECRNTGMPEHLNNGTPEYHFHFEGKL